MKNPLPLVLEVKKIKDLAEQGEYPYDYDDVYSDGLAVFLNGHNIYDIPDGSRKTEEDVVEEFVDMLATIVRERLGYKRPYDPRDD